MGITFELHTRKYVFEHPELDKNWQEFTLTFETTDDTDLEVFASVDGGGFTSIGTINLSSGAPKLPQTLPFFLASAARVTKTLSLRSLGWGKDIQFRLLNTEADKAIKLVGLEVSAFPIPQRKRV